MTVIRQPPLPDPVVRRQSDTPQKVIMDVTGADEAELSDHEARLQALEAQPKITVSATPPVNPAIHDLWVDIS